MKFSPTGLSTGATATLVVLLGTLVLLALGRSSIERRMLFYPTHRGDNNGWNRWMSNGQVIGFARTVASPKNVWLMLHGNAGQASDRGYALAHFSPEDAVYVLEYPGYGVRPGTPSRDAFDRAAGEAYQLLRQTYPRTPVCVASESIGSGPACVITRLSPPPDKMVLIVPFDRLSAVAEDHFPSFLVRLFLTDDWDNAQALAGYRGPVDIFGAESDTIIPVKHARALAAAVPQARLAIIPGGHNDWSSVGRVAIRNASGS
ncbi:MAG TPA: alpha/beta hydrolase [bacterium]